MLPPYKINYVFKNTPSPFSEILYCIYTFEDNNFDKIICETSCKFC